MTLTSVNKLSFKEYLKDNKGLFFSNLVNSYMGDISPIIANYPAGTNALTPIKIIPFSYNETVDLSGRIVPGDYLYLPGTSNDKIILKNGADTKTFTFNSSGNINENLNSTYELGGIIFKVVSIGGGLLSLQGAPTYNIIESSTAVVEGDTITFTINTTNIGDNTTLYYTISGTVSAADFTDNTLSGSVVINNNSGSFSKTLLNDLSIVATEGEENFTVSLRTGSINGTIVDTTNIITVEDTSTSSYTLTQSTSSVDEGQSVSFTLTTTGITDGTILYYTTTGTASTTTDITALSGSFTINNNSGTFSINVNQDYEIDDAETLTVSVRVGSVSGSIVATSQVITIDDTPFTITIVPASTVIPESTITTNSTLSVDINTTDVTDGTNFTAFIDLLGSVNSSDFGQTSFPFTINNSTANISIPISRDARTEGTETFTISVKNQNNTVVATSPVIVITDSSFIGSRKTDKTFGPIQVNRDNGNSANTSDWYTLCGLDNIPNGSKIVLFLDNSGSMTTDTVRASLNEFLIKLQQRDITIEVVENSTEDWITPFNKDIL
jgi:hypothetical protein